MGEKKVIIAPEEVKKIYGIVSEVEEELKQDGIPYRVPEQGNKSLPPYPGPARRWRYTGKREHLRSDCIR